MHVSDGNRRERIEGQLHAWRFNIERSEESASSLVVFGTSDGVPAVAKFARQADQVRLGQALQAFDGHGAVRVYDSVDGAVLMERLTPGTPLSDLVAAGKDEQATGILADVIAKLSSRVADEHGPLNADPQDEQAFFPAAAELAAGFDQYLQADAGPIPGTLVREACRVYHELCDSQSEARLLHGDLHHGNVLFDSKRGWLAIDPRGVIGELEFELGAALRNPIEMPEVFTAPPVIEKRVADLAGALRLDRDRIVRWAFSQAVLAAIWRIEDGEIVAARHPWLVLSSALARA